MARLMSWFLAVVLVTSLAVVATRANEESPGPEPKRLKVIMVTDEAGLGDQGFNDVTWQGVVKARAELGIQASESDVIKSEEQGDYVPNLNFAAAHADIVISVGFMIADALAKVAPMHPKTYFIHIEGDVPGENVVCFDFKGEEGGYLAGLVAGMFTRGGKVGVVAGREIPPVEAYLAGFEAGVKSASANFGKKAETIIVYAGSFDNPEKGKSLANSLIAKGCDVLFRAAGNTGIGVCEAVKENEKVYLIWEDIDHDALLPGRILVSTLKKIDVAVYNAISGAKEGKFRAGHYLYGVRENGMGISEMKHSSGLFTREELVALARAKEMLAAGEIEVPKRRADVVSFSPPLLR